eukprot:4663293-Pyramimonas_sp.AAC.1
MCGWSSTSTPQPGLSETPCGTSLWPKASRLRALGATERSPASSQSHLRSQRSDHTRTRPSCRGELVNIAVEEGLVPPLRQRMHLDASDA